jgi:hypothetical protein
VEESVNQKIYGWPFAFRFRESATATHQLKRAESAKLQKYAQSPADFLASQACRGGVVGAEYSLTMAV